MTAGGAWALGVVADKLEKEDEPMADVKITIENDEDVELDGVAKIVFHDPLSGWLSAYDSDGMRLAIVPLRLIVHIVTDTTSDAPGFQVEAMQIFNAH